MTDRAITTMIAGRAYPLCLTLRATKEITSRFGGLEELADSLSGAGLETQLDTMTWLLGVLIREGCAMMRIMDEAAPEPLPAEALECILTPADLIAMQPELMRAIRIGVGREVEPKNAEAGPTNAGSLPG